MYLPSPVCPLTGDQLTARGWNMVYRITDLPPVGVPVLFRVEQIDSKSNTFTPLVQHYVGWLSRLVHGIKKQPDTLNCFDVVAVPECFIETPYGPVCVPDLTIKAWTHLDNPASLPWRHFTGEEDCPPLGHPILVREHHLLKTRDYFYDLYYVAYPLQLVHGYERVQDKHSDLDFDEKDRLLLSVPHPDPEKTKVLCRDMLEYRPLTLPEPDLLL